MPIQEPTESLWTDVKPLTEWPETDEDAMKDLASAWGHGGAALERAGYNAGSPGLVNGWTDGNGKTYQARIGEMLDLTFRTGVKVKELSWLVEQYGLDVEHTKKEISRIIKIRDEDYRALNGFFGLFADTSARQAMVLDAAAAINDFLATMADRITARDKGEPEIPRPVFVLETGPPDAAAAAPPPPPAGDVPDPGRHNQSNNKYDPAADKLAQRIGGQPQRAFEDGPHPGREIDAVSDRYIAQSKPANFALGRTFRDQAKATFEIAQATGRTPYFHFEGPPRPGVLEAIQRYAERYNLEPVIDLRPLAGG